MQPTVPKSTRSLTPMDSAIEPEDKADGLAGQHQGVVTDELDV
jgi:hypothetical protein